MEPDQKTVASKVFDHALKLHESGQLAEAESLYARVLELTPEHSGALHYFGVLRYQQNNPAEALSLLARAHAIGPVPATYLSNYAAILHKLGRLDDALARLDEALAAKPDLPEAHFNRGNVLNDLERYEDALASFERAISLKNDYAAALNNRGNALRALKRPEDALASYDSAIAMLPNFAEAHNNRGNALNDLRQLERALASYEQALAIQPDYVEALNNRAGTLRNLERLDDALASYDKVLAIQPDYIDALIGRGHVLSALDRDEEAIANYEQALAIEPSHPHALDALAMCAKAACDWARTARLRDIVIASVKASNSFVSPFNFLSYSCDPALQLQCTRAFVQLQLPNATQVLSKPRDFHHDKIRIAYLSAGFHEHATAYLMADLFERHNRARFDVMGISFGIDDGSEMRSRLIRAFDRFHDVRSTSDRGIAMLLRDLGVDIAVDLMGHTAGSRLGILAFRPAPIQVSYLGYPGTLAAEFIDYIIADKVVLPFEQQQFFMEKIVHLPDCYQVNDSRRQISKHTPTRGDEGLPANGFVFCCFNNNYKITGPLFDIWMRLLKSVPSSVLWLLRGNHAAESNLQHEAARRGVDPRRLVFASRVPLEQHLARHRLADLFLDTLPINAHTTASDALWAGLPVLTCCGASFAGRVAASLLTAVGLPELVTYDLRQYEDLAGRLMTENNLLSEFKARLDRNRTNCPLFNTDRFRHHIETAYVAMWELLRRGEGPRSFGIQPNDEVRFVAYSHKDVSASSVWEDMTEPR